MKIPTARSTPIDPRSRRPTRSSPQAGFSSSRALHSTTSRPRRLAPPPTIFPSSPCALGLANRVEFRTFWFGQTYSQTQSRPGGPWTQLNGPSDMEIGFKWQLIKGNEDNKWIPTTALITSIYRADRRNVAILVGNGRSVHQSDLRLDTDREADRWRQHGVSGKTRAFRSTARSTQRQLRAIPPIAPRVLFAGGTNHAFLRVVYLDADGSGRNRAMSYMDGGVLYRLSPNMQLDLRVGFGLNGRPDELFTGAGFSVRF